MSGFSRTTADPPEGGHYGCQGVPSACRADSWLTGAGNVYGSGGIEYREQIHGPPTNLRRARR